MNLENKIKDKSVVVGIIGLGYVGLPLAHSFSDADIQTIGFDLSEKKIKMINDGVSYIPDISTEKIKIVVKDKKTLWATTDFTRLKEVDAVFICVPTPFNKQKAPDLSYVESAAESVAQNLQKGQIVILQSTTYPGTTEDIVQPILEQAGLKAGKDFYLAFSPERIDPGNKNFDAHNTPKVCGGIDQKSTRLAADLFRLFIDDDKVHEVSSPKTAEMCKILENTFRSVNIALVNEMLKLSERMGIDIWEVIDAAATKPFGFMPFYPGPGVGGHCIPVDPFYLSWKAREYDFFTRFIELSADINMNMPYYTIDRLQSLLSENNIKMQGAKILVLGAAFKKDIDDYRNSVAIYLIKLLLSRGVEVHYNDPYVPEITLAHDLYMKANKQVYKSEEITQKSLQEIDAVLLAVPHSDYDIKFIVDNSRLVFDAVNGTKGIKSDKITKL